MHGTEFAELNAFLAVAERSNFARAAAHLNLSPSTISQTIRALEARLGVRLFNRTTRSVSLTDAGEKLLVRLRPAMMEIGAAVEDLNAFRNTPTGVLRLSISNAAAQIVLAPRIETFLAAYPAISLDVTVDDGQGDIADGRFDAGIRVGRLVARNMQTVRVSAPSRLIAVASPRYLERNPVPKTPQDLQRHNCIRLRSDNQIILWDFAKGKTKVEISATGSLTVNNVSLMVRSALEGIGVAYTIESYVAADIASGRLIPLLTDWSQEHQSYYLYYSGRRHVPVPLKVFSDFLRSSMVGEE